MDAPTQSDIEHATETYNEICSDPESYDGPEIIMTSRGYAQVWSDGEVTSGQNMASHWFKVDEDGLVE